MYYILFRFPSYYINLLIPESKYVIIQSEDFDKLEILNNTEFEKLIENIFYQIFNIKNTDNNNSKEECYKASLLYNFNINDFINNISPLKFDYYNENIQEDYININNGENEDISIVTTEKDNSDLTDKWDFILGIKSPHHIKKEQHKNENYVEESYQSFQCDKLISFLSPSIVKRKHKNRNKIINNSFILSNNILKMSKVIGQFDKKFIVFYYNNTIILADQV